LINFSVGLPSCSHIPSQVADLTILLRMVMPLIAVFSNNVAMPYLLLLEISSWAHTLIFF
jgi:hypothetical protein